MIKQGRYDDEISKRALELLLIDRRNEFREISSVILGPVPESAIQSKDSEFFVINFCMDVNAAFKTWAGKEPLTNNSGLKALTILRQLSRNKSTMNELTHLLNIAYTLAEEFKAIYKRLK